LSHEQLLLFEKTGGIELCGHTISAEGMSLTRRIADLDSPGLESSSDSETVVILDFTPDKALAERAFARDIATRLQRLRKRVGLPQEAAVDIWLEVLPGPEGEQHEEEARPPPRERGGRPEDGLAGVLARQRAYMASLTRKPLWDAGLRQGHEVVVASEDIELTGPDIGRLHVVITERAPFFNGDALAQLLGDDMAAEASCRQQVLGLDPQSLGGEIHVTHQGRTFRLNHGEHFAIGPEDALWL